MKSRHLWFWFLLAAGLASFIAIRARRPVVVPGPNLVLSAFATNSVTAVQILPHGKTEIRAGRTNGTWYITKPLDYPAMPLAIEELLGQLQKLVPMMTISSSELKNRPKADEEFGTDDPRASLMIQQGGTETRLLFGRLTAPGDQVYLQIVGRQEVYLVSSELLKMLPTTASEWRDPSMLTVAPAAIDRICVTNGAKILELQRDPASRAWRIMRPTPEARADSLSVEGALNKLQQLRVNQFISDSPQADYEAFKLQPPLMDIGLFQSNHLVTQLQFGASPTNDAELVYARRAGQPAVVTVFKDLTKFWTGSAKDMRDPRLVTFPDGVVTNIEIHGVQDFSLQYGTNGIWALQPQNTPVDAAFVKEMFTRLVSIQITGVAKDIASEPLLPEFGLAPPAKRYIFRGLLRNGGVIETNTFVTEVDFGTNLENQIYARRPDEPSVYTVGIVDVGRLPYAPWQFRDRQIWNVPIDEVASVSIRQNGNLRQILRSGGHKWSLAPGSSGIIEPICVEEAIKNLCQLTADGWVRQGEDQRAPFGFTDAGQKITLDLKDGRRLTLEFSQATHNKNMTLAGVTLDGQFMIFLFPNDVYTRFISPCLSVPANSSP